MKLLSATPSPFVAKCRMAAAHLGIELEAVPTDAGAEAAELLEANPLGKIPCLVDGDEAVFDSRVIARYLNAKAKGSLYPKDTTFSVPRMEALVDGIADAAVAYQYELRFHSDETVSQPWLDRQWGKVCRGLDVVDADPPVATGKLNAASLSLAATLGYLDLRFPGKWQEGHGHLLDWQTRFDAQHPKLAALKPSA